MIQPCGCRIFDVTGKLVETQILSGGKSYIRLENFAQGVYTIELSGSNKAISRKLVVVK